MTEKEPLRIEFAIPGLQEYLAAEAVVEQVQSGDLSLEEAKAKFDQDPQTQQIVDDLTKFPALPADRFHMITRVEKTDAGFEVLYE